MKSTDIKNITVSTLVKSPVKRVWELWTGAHHNLHWNSGSAEWHTTRAENDLRPGGKFLFRMEAKDMSMGFDFEGVYNSIQRHKFISYTIADGRQVNIVFTPHGDSTEITETFEAEKIHPAELQRTGWQYILDNFKRYSESPSVHDVLHFEVIVNNVPERAFVSMIDDKTYREWTSVFNPASFFKGSWEKGSKIHFIGTDSSGNTGGMVSRIRENVPWKFLSIEHIGILKNDQEIICGPEVDQWKGSLENYTFTPVNGKTLISVDIDSNEEFRSYFSETWPKALNKLKTICER